MQQTFTQALDVLMSILPVVIALNGFFAVWAKLPKVGGAWATNLSKLCAIAQGDLGGLIRILERFWASLQSQEAKQVATPSAAASLTLANADDIRNFHVGQKIQVVTRDTQRGVIGILPVSLLMLLSGCAATIPTPSTPCAGLYCLEWSGSVVGLPGSALICAKTEEEARQAAKALLDRDPRSTVRKVGAK